MLVKLLIVKLLIITTVIIIAIIIIVIYVIKCIYNTVTKFIEVICSISDTKLIFNSYFDYSYKINFQ